MSHSLSLSLSPSLVCLSARMSVCLSVGPSAFLPDTENGVKLTGIGQDPGPGRRPTCRFEFQLYINVAMAFPAVQYLYLRYSRIPGGVVPIIAV